MAGRKRTALAQPAARASVRARHNENTAAAGAISPRPLTANSQLPLSPITARLNAQEACGLLMPRATASAVLDAAGSPAKHSNASQGGSSMLNEHWGQAVRGTLGGPAYRVPGLRKP